jgi:hypothetical protein
MSDQALNALPCEALGPQRRRFMTDEKKKGDFDQWQRDDVGGNKKSHSHARNSRTAHKQNAGGGSRH